MTEQQPGKDIETFVRKGDDGEQRVLNLGPWPGSPVIDGGMPHIQMMVLQLGDGEPGELRHLSYDDPPGVGSDPEEWHQLLLRAAGSADNEAEFVQMLVMALGRDLVMAHGCQPHIAVPAIIEFARKVYAEYLSL